MKNSARYGLGIALVASTLTLILYSLGYHTEKMESSQSVGLLVLFVPIVGILLALRANRANAISAGVEVSYGGAFRHGMSVVLFWAVGSAAFAYFYYGYLNTEMVEYVIEIQRAELAAEDIPESQWEGLEAFTRSLFRADVQALIAFLVNALYGLVICLVGAAFYKNRPASGAAGVTI